MENKEKRKEQKKSSKVKKVKSGVSKRLKFVNVQ